MIPKVVFKKMTLEENIDHIKWMYFNNEGEFSIKNATLEYFPDLKKIDCNMPKEKIYTIIEELVKECYDCSLSKIEKDEKKYNEIWEKYNNHYFTELAQYLNIEWPKDRKIIVANVGLIPIFPRYLDTFSFALSFSMNEADVVEVVAHETLHFLWFEKWKQLYPTCKRKEYDSPFLPWKYSEMVTDPILNSKNINRILNIKEKAYNSFYELIDNKNNNVMDMLKNIYESNDKIEEKIIKGYDYIKNI